MIAGYTNAGKSSLLNRLTGAGVLVEDALFATLDPAVRRAETPYGRTFTLTDTVGFVRHLPHQLVEAFRSTLEETAEADLILHVVDGSDAEPEAQLAAVRDVLAEIGAAHVPELVRGQQDRRRRPGDPAGPARAGAGQPQRLRQDRGRPDRAARRRSRPRCRGSTSRSGSPSRTAAATWSPGPTPRARCWPPSTVEHGTLLEARVPPGLAAQLERRYQLEAASTARGQHRLKTATLQAAADDCVRSVRDSRHVWRVFHR